MAQKSDHMGMHTEQLAGRTQQRFFSPEEDENFVYPGSFDVDFNKRAEFDAGSLDSKEINLKLRELMSQGYGTIVMKNAGSTFGAAIRGGDLVCLGDVGARVGIDMKGGTIIVGGRAGAFCGFMMQRGRMVILGDAGKNLGDSMYDGTIYVGGKIAGLGVDAVPGEMNDVEADWLERKLKLYGLAAPKGVRNLQKIVAGRQLWNYDNLEPTEKKLIL